MIKYYFLFSAILFSHHSNSQFIAHTENDKPASFTDLQLKFDEWRNAHENSDDENADENADENGAVYKRWEYEQLMHTMPDGEPASSQLYLSEILKGTNKKQACFKNTSQGLWTSFGPDALPPSPDPYQQHGMGRINCMAFHPNDPNTYWIGVAQGGIWKTTDNGSSWTSISDQLPILRISDIAVDPNNTDIIYASVCDFEYIDFGMLQYGRKRNTFFGMGVYKTTDGGQTWNPTGLSFQIQDEQASLIRKVLINSIDGSKLVAIGESGLYTSADSGIAWTHVLDTLTWDLAQDPSSPNTIYAATGYLTYSKIGYASIMKSTDFGQTWTMLNTGIPPIGAVQRIKLAIAPTDPNYIYAICVDINEGLYGIYKSTDAGNSWNLQYNALNILDWDEGSGTSGQGTYDLSFMVSPNDKNTVYAGGVNLWGSTDGAVTFNPISYWYGFYGASIHADQHFLTCQPITDTYFECTDGGIYHSANLITQSWNDAYNGNPWPTSWTNISSGMAITSFYRISSSKTTDGRIMGGAQDNSTFYFDGSAWTNIIGGDGMDNWMDPNDQFTLIGSSQYGNFQKSIDGGNTSNYLNISNEEGEWTTPIIANYSNGYLYTGYGDVYKSTNKGSNWKKISSFPVDVNSGYLPEISAMAVAASNPNVLYITKRVRYEYNIKGTCYTTTNGGTSWTDITSGLPDSLYFTSVEISSDDENIAWVTCAGLSDGNKIFKTIDGGLTWTNISYDLPNLPVNVVKQIPGSSNHKILIGTDLGVYYIDDSTYTWTSYSNGLPNVIVSDIEFNPALNKIYVSTFGRGIWQSDLSDIVSKIVTQANSIDFSLFPSPVNSNQNISIQLQNDYIGKINMKMYDMNGHLIKASIMNKTSYLFSPSLISPTNSGIYWIEINLGANKAKHEFIVR